MQPQHCQKTITTTFQRNYLLFTPRKSPSRILPCTQNELGWRHPIHNGYAFQRHFHEQYTINCAG